MYLYPKCTRVLYGTITSINDSQIDNNFIRSIKRGEQVEPWLKNRDFI